MLLHLQAELGRSLSAPEGGIRLITTMKGEQQLVSDSLQDVNKFIWYIVDKMCVTSTALFVRTSVWCLIME